MLASCLQEAVSSRNRNPPARENCHDRRERSSTRNGPEHQPPGLSRWAGDCHGDGAPAIRLYSRREDTYAPEQAPDYYPPALTGLRGSHPGSYEVAHQLRDGTLEPAIGRTRDTGERYDLVVVGAGISGLAAAYFYRKARPEARILLLDNHDDLGGHAKPERVHRG